MSQRDKAFFYSYKRSTVSNLGAVASDFRSVFVDSIRNDAVLACAKNYLDLSENLHKKEKTYSPELLNAANLPEDLQQVERGVEILCATYVTAANNQTKEVCQDVERELNSLSSFYQHKVTQAYVSACNILLDADDMLERPEVLKQLKQSRDALQKMHYNWPVVDDDISLTHFFEKVDYYGRQLGIDGQVSPEKKSEKVFVLAHFSSKIARNERCA